MLFFYRGGWCPFCNSQIHGVTEAYPGFRARGITPVFLSAERPDEAARLSTAYEVPFPILSDPDIAALRAFRVTYRLEGEELRELARFGIDLERTSGRDHHTIAIPSIFLIWHGVIRWAHSDPDFTVRPSPEQLFEVLDELGLEPREEGEGADPN
jgi:peroxiredoxin